MSLGFNERTTTLVGIHVSCPGCSSFVILVFFHQNHECNLSAPLSVLQSMTSHQGKRTLFSYAHFCQHLGNQVPGSKNDFRKMLPGKVLVDLYIPN